MQFQCRQIKHAIPQLWKDSIKNFARNLSNLSIQDHHLIKCHRILNLEKLNCGGLYKTHLSSKYEKSICQTYQEKKSDNYSFDWKMIYGIPRTSTYDRKVIKSYINSELSLALNVPSVIYMMKHHCIYFMNVFMHKIYATNLDYILQKKIDLTVLTPECHL